MVKGANNMKLEDIQDCMLVVANGEDYYDGLVGETQIVRRDKKEFETENDSQYEIVTDFLPTDNMKVTHPDLNGTSVADLIMGEEDLIYFPNGWEQEGYDSKGNTYHFEDVILQNEAYKEKVKCSHLIY